MNEQKDDGSTPAPEKGAAEPITGGGGPAEEATSADTVPPEVARPMWLRLFGHDVSGPLLLLLLSLFLFVPGQWTVPPLDRDEPRYTQATKQMLETGDYVDIRFQEQARHKKPVGIYWLQSAAVHLSGQGVDAPLWVYRLPSAISAVIAVLASFWLARAFMGPGGALIVGLFTASAIIVGVEARLAKTDAALLATVIIAQGALARIWLKESGKRQWLMGFVFWTALAGSILIKGPIGPMICGLTVIALMALRRRIAWFKAASPILGMLWTLLLVLPWLVAIWIATDGAFFKEAIVQDLLGKVGEGQESHGAPPLTHLGVMFGIFWPLPAFFMIALPLIWRERSSALVTFAIAWFVPSWIVFELVATKLPHYTMPLLPALALPVAAALMDGAGASAPKWQRWIAALLLAVPAVGIAIGTVGGPAFLGLWPSPPGAVIAGFGVITAIAAARALVRGPALNALPAAVSTAVLVAVAVWGFSGPALKTIWVSPRLVAAMDQVPGCADRNSRQVVTAGFHEPSFIFLEGTDTWIVKAEAAAEFLASHPAGANGSGCWIAAIESREEEAFLAAAQEIGLVPSVQKRVEGLNINGGDQVDIALYRNIPVEGGGQAGSNTSE